MATTFTNAKIASIANTRTLAYEAPANTQGVVSGLFITNLDDGNKLDHYLTIEVRDSSLAYSMIANDVIVPYGSTLILDKAVILLPGERLYVTGSTTGVMSLFASILERS